MENIFEMISRAPSWLIIIVVLGFVVEPLIKAMKRRKAKQETGLQKDSGQRSVAAFSGNPMFPRSKTLRPLDPASLYRDDNAASWEDRNNDYDDDYDDFDEYDDYNKR